MDTFDLETLKEIKEVVAGFIDDLVADRIRHLKTLTPKELEDVLFGTAYLDWEEVESMVECKLLELEELKKRKRFISDTFRSIEIHNAREKNIIRQMLQIYKGKNYSKLENWIKKY